MLLFYKKVAAIFAILTILTALFVYICVRHAYLHDELLPVQENTLAWALITNTDEEKGGSSSVTLNDKTYTLDFSFFTTAGFTYPFISVATEFVDSESKNRLVDLSKYSKATFSVKCDPSNVLSFMVAAFDDNLSLPGDIATYRIPSTYFSCTQEWTKIEIDLRQMEIPEWWLMQHEIDLSDQEYNLGKVYSLHFNNSAQSPKDTPSNVKITELTLHGRDWRYFFSLGALAVFLWAGVAIWFFRRLAKELVADITNRIQQDKAMVAYKQLSMEPKKDRDRSTVLRYIATEYSNSELNLELASNKLGINRNKINDILRDELGLTFNTYLNKLRLTEAARLLTQEEDANVAEISSLVGYNNSSYFTKLFKKEYGYSPTNFKNIYQKK